MILLPQPPSADEADEGLMLDQMHVFQLLCGCINASCSACLLDTAAVTEEVFRQSHFFQDFRNSLQNQYQLPH